MVEAVEYGQIAKVLISNQIKDAPIIVDVTLHKEITPVNVIFETVDPTLQHMLEEARSLKTIPQRERPRRLVELLRAHVNFSNSDDLERIEKENAEKAWKITANDMRPIIGAQTLQEAVQLGYGNANALSISMLILGKEAGLEGAYLSNGNLWGFAEGDNPNPIVNITRSDTNKPLFGCFPNEKGVHMPKGYAWVEYRTTDGWIPVDPSAQLIGDTEQGLQMFRDAHYQASVDVTTRWKPDLGKVNHNGVRDLEFHPAEPQHTGTFRVFPHPGSTCLEISRPQLPANMANMVLGVNYSIVSAETA